MDGFDSGLYLDITGFAHRTPEWVQRLGEAFTEAGLLLFGLLFVLAWWRARRGDSAALTLAVLAPVATAVAYVASEVLKSAVVEERPCRAVAGAPVPLIACPAHGDWSFPSNHSVIAAGAALSLALAWRGIARLTVPIALLMAFSRVFVGVHYPHDVLAGLAFGALLALLVLRAGRRPLERVVLAMRSSSAGPVRWFTGPGSGPGAVPAPAAGGPRHAAQRR